MPARKRRKPYDREKIRRVKEEGYAPLMPSSQKAVPLTILFLARRCSWQDTESAYAFHFKGDRLSLRRMGEETRHHGYALESGFLETIRNGADSKDDREREYCLKELRRLAFQLGRRNFFAPRNMTVWFLEFEDDRPHFSGPYDYDRESPTGISRYHNIAPSTKPYAALPPIEIGHRALSVSRFPVYEAKATIYRN